jgi:hypothetical protein
METFDPLYGPVDRYRVLRTPSLMGGVREDLSRALGWHLGAYVVEFAEAFITLETGHISAVIDCVSCTVEFDPTRLALAACCLFDCRAT